MANKGVITRKDIITEEALRFGEEYAKNVKLAIQANKELIQSTLQLNDIANSFKAGDGSKAFKKNKEDEIKLTNKMIDQQKKLSQLNATIEKEKQAGIATEQKLLRLSQQKETQQRKNNKLSIDERVTLQQQNKEARQEAILKNRIVGAYQKLNLERTRAKTTLQNLIASENASSASIKKAQAEFDRLDKKVKKADTAVKDFSKNVGNYPNQMGKAIGSLKNLASALGVVGGVALLAKTMKESVGIIKDFELQIATLGGISGATEKQLESLRSKAITLGSTTEFTASQVAELQTEFARLGFVPEIIEAITEPTLQAATALETDLAGAAKLVGSNLKAFNLDAEQASQVADALASATTKSALDFEKLSTGLAIVAPVAKNANVSLERTTAQLGVLSDRGIDASTAGTGLRNIFLEVAKRGTTVEAAFKKINNSTNKNATAMELFGKRGATVATILAENQKQTEELTVALVNSGGAAEDLAKKKLATLDGSLKKLSSAWEGFILQTNDASGAGDFLSSTVLFLANNLDTIITILGVLTGGWVLYKVAVFSANKALLLYNAGSRAVAVTQAFLNGGLKRTIATFRTLNAVSKANVFGAIVVAITALIFVFKQLNKEVSASEKAQKKLNDAEKDAEKTYAKEKVSLKSLVDVAKDENLSKADRLKAIEKLNAISPEYLGNLTLENINTEEGARLLDEYVKALDKKALAQAITAKKEELFKSLLEQQNTGLEENIDFLDKAKAAFLSFGNAQQFALQISKSGVKNQSDRTKSIQEEIDAFDELTKKMIEAGEVNIDDLLGGGVTEGSDDKGNGNDAAQKAATAKHKLKIAQLQEEIRIQQDIANDEFATLQERIKAQIAFNDAKIELLKVNRDFELVNIAKTSKSKTESDARKAALEIKYQKDRAAIAHAGNDMYLSILKTGFEHEKKSIAEAKELNNQALKDAIIAENEAFEKSGKSLEDVKAHEKAIADIKKQFALEGVEAQIAEVERLLRMDGFTTEQRKALSEQLKDLKITHSNITTDAVVADLEKQAEKEKALAALKEQIISKGINTLAMALNIDENNLKSFVDDMSEYFKEGFEASTKGVLESMSLAATVVGDVLGSIYDSNIQNLEGQLEASDEYYARQTELAGNDQRQKDLIEGEAEKKRQALEKKIAKEKTKKAKADKAMAIVQAGINTALAITSALTQAPPASYVLAALSAAMGIAQIAVIASKPIPKFKDGHLSGTHEGLAITNDGGRAEVWERDGKAQIIQGVNTPIMMKRGDKIHKSVEDYENLMRASILSSVDINNNNLSDFEAKKSFNDNTELLNEIKALRQDLNKKKPTHIHMPKIDIEHEVWKQQNTNW